MVRNRILVVEDDPSMQDVYRHFSELVLKDRYVFHLVPDAESALDHLDRQPVDSIVLDWSLPGMSGMELLSIIRSRHSMRPVLVFLVTAKDGPDDFVACLKAGADDYLCKPVSTEELAAKLQSLFRRRDWDAGRRGAIELDDLKLDLASGRLFVGLDEVQLNSKEQQLLDVLMRRPNIIHSADGLWDRVWGYPSSTQMNTLRVHMCNLRKKLGPKWGERLECQRGMGYLLRSEAGCILGAAA